MALCDPSRLSGATARRTGCCVLKGKLYCLYHSALDASDSKQAPQGIVLSPADLLQKTAHPTVERDAPITEEIRLHLVYLGRVPHLPSPITPMFSMFELLAAGLC
jgi:hypothetical protein